MILLVGVAHVLDMRKYLTGLFSEVAPAAIAIELDPDRLASLLERSQSDGKGPPGGKPAGTPLLLRVWSTVQDRLAADLGDIPGSEMLVAYQAAQELKVPLFLIDDPIRQVAPRLMSSLTPRERVLLLISSVFALVTPSRIVKKELANYTQDREAYVAAMRSQFPSMARVLLDERNLHMAQRLKLLSDKFGKVVAVVGDAHVSGLEGLLRTQTEVTVRHLVAEA